VESRQSLARIVIQALFRRDETVIDPEYETFHLIDFGDRTWVARNEGTT